MGIVTVVQEGLAGSRVEEEPNGAAAAAAANDETADVVAIVAETMTTMTR
jgi:hypothetical protein